MGMKEIIIEVPEDFGTTLQPFKATCEINGEIIRCKDCIYYAEKTRCCNGWQMGMRRRVEKNDFCSDGERKDK